MRDIQRAAVDVLAALAALFVQIAGEVVDELELLVEALVAALARRQQYSGDADLVEVGLQVAPVTIGHLEAEAVDHRLRLQARIQRDAALLGNFAIGSVKEVAIQLESRVVQLDGGGAGILQADHVGILGLQPAEQATLDRPLNAIHVDTDDPHK